MHHRIIMVINPRDPVAPSPTPVSRLIHVTLGRVTLAQQHKPTEGRRRAMKYTHAPCIPT